MPGKTHVDTVASAYLDREQEDLVCPLLFGLGTDIPLPSRDPAQSELTGTDATLHLKRPTTSPGGTSCVPFHR